MDDRRNYYRVLHLQPDAPIELVRGNFRTLMQKLGAHPDLGGEDWSAAHLNAAYHTLSDPDRRAAYDLDLLARYDIVTLAEGRAKPRVRGPATPQQDGKNRRSYYRVLQVQRDAPLAILQGCHQALRKANPQDAAELDAAIALLSDETLRATYDRLLEVCDHHGALVRMNLAFPAAPHATPGYQPVITSYCTFCKTPHRVRQDELPDARCSECRSPLFPPADHFLGLARRALPRDLRDEPVTLFLVWPSGGIPAKLIDLSPTGMSCETVAPLDAEDVMKITSVDFDAIGSVAHANRTGEGTTAGLRFLTVHFQEARGTFRSIKA